MVTTRAGIPRQRRTAERRDRKWEERVKRRQLQSFSPAASGGRLTGVEDGGVDPALGVADGHRAAGVGQQDLCAAGPGSWRHPVGVVAAPVAHQHAVVVSRIQLNGGKVSIGHLD